MFFLGTDGGVFLGGFFLEVVAVVAGIGQQVTPVDF